jgi:octaprenyl-diphosphate synthase
MIHNATLLHDDVIDEGLKRRGDPTINSLWGNESAVLLGDFLLSRVLRMCADLEPEVIRIIADAAGRTCEGELRQVIQKQNWQLSESEYIQIITEKSAALFRGSCSLGGLLAGGSKAQIRLLGDFGLDVGVAFQIADDLLDLTGTESKTGKTLGRDVDRDKPTLAIIHLLTSAEANEKGSLQNRLSDCGQNRESLAEMLRSHRSLEYVRGRVQAFVAKAIVALSNLRQSAATEALIETARFIERQAG